MEKPPFEQKFELYSKLTSSTDILTRIDPSRSTTQTSSYAPNPSVDYHIPGQPSIRLNNHAEIYKHLKDEFITERLDKFEPHLWLIAKPDSAHISSLTEHIVRGRNIIISEDPGLHLVWIHDRVFMKPIPKYMFSHAFWKFYLTSAHSSIAEDERRKILRAAVGFLRTYVYPIRHKSDYILAQSDEHRLISQKISFSAFIRFIEAFRIDDGMVSPRYQFGQLRLTRLNFWIRILFFEYAYMKVHGQYGDYAARFYGPFLLIFATFSVLLAAMQVGLASLSTQAMGSWDVLVSVSRWFSIVTLVIVILTISLLMVALAFLGVRESSFAIKKKYIDRRRDPQKIAAMADVEKRSTKK